MQRTNVSVPDTETSVPPLYQLEACVLYRDDTQPLLSIHRAIIESGQFTCITGPSGAGKSSLLLSLAGLNRRLSGSLLFKGQALSAANSAALRRSDIGIVFQHMHLFDELDAMSNASIHARWAQRSERQGIVEEAGRLLDALGINDPQTRCGKLSGGQRQRVAVARALAGHASVVLADEPTASLDAHTGKAMIDVMLNHTVHSGRTLVACTHDAAMIEQADVLWQLSDGRLQRVS